MLSFHRIQPEKAAVSIFQTQPLGPACMYYGKVILHWILFSFMRLLIMYVKQVRVVKQVKFSLIKKCLHNSELHFLPISRADLICLTLPIDFKSLSAKKEMDGMLLCLI